ncbi:mitotic checkpoint protein prcc-carboxy-term protein [Rhizoctonia solani AG-3 Rhs1AP]|uniref:Mitotic checkpoint protein prcc-carboxy-term protein n=1 Tax=Rhizoctonia solani AG-3 Rhs1AP TaxID=1086054 RepID=X8JSH7_9AGAM|nr:mitotic checkpoint protein prcc-carboxy-term protein [Rhizoctonia solani AG-3 Rhs1AP]
MLGGLASYGSDSEGEEEATQTPHPKATTVTATPADTDSKSSNGSLASSLALPPPKKRRDGPVRITVEAPKFDDGDEEAERAQKKPRTLGTGTKGAGASALFSALPAPKNAAPILPESKRVLGGGGGAALNFSTASTKSSGAQSTSNGLFLPPAMAKAKAQAKAPPPAIESAPSVDFFSLGSTANAAPSVSASDAPQSSSSSITLMSAPEVKDFEPPVPTLFDPYPGYYQLPSGEWAMHDPKYYKKVIEQLTSGPDMQAQNKSEAREFAGSSREDMATFDPGEELRRGQIAELEKRKAVTATPADAPAAPRMKVQKATGLARSRHQLSTLLTEAYANREALEERIAQGKRNRKEAGSKYGKPAEICMWLFVLSVSFQAFKVQL